MLDCIATSVLKASHSNGEILMQKNHLMTDFQVFTDLVAIVSNYAWSLLKNGTVVCRYLIALATQPFHTYPTHAQCDQ